MGNLLPQVVAYVGNGRLYQMGKSTSKGGRLNQDRTSVKAGISRRIVFR